MSYQIEAIGFLPANLREIYLSSLAYAQEFFLEQLVKVGKKCLIRRNGDVVGYAVAHKKSIVEFFLLPEALKNMPEIFRETRQHFAADSALVKSFDAQMVAAAGTDPATVKTKGVLFRQILTPEFRAEPGIIPQLAVSSDLPLVLKVHDGFFSGEAEVLDYINDQGLFLYWRNGILVGCGILKRIIEGRPDFDIGMVVAPAYRRQGLGAYIIGHLKSYCLGRGFRPVCGCSAENPASCRAIESAGFVSGHVILGFSFSSLSQ